MKKFYTSLLTAVAGLTALSASALNYTVDPASGSTVTSLTKVHITAPDIEAFAAMGMQDENHQVKVTKDGADFCGVTFSDTDDSGNWYTNFNEMDIILSTPATEPGTYVIDIPAGALMDDASGSVTPWNDEAIKLTYTIEGNTPGGSLNYTVDPASGSTVTSLTKVHITAPDIEAFAAMGMQDENHQVKVTKDGADFCGVTFSDTDDSGNWYTNFNEMDIILSTPATEPGTYVIDIPAGALMDDASGSVEPWNDEAIKLTYTIEGDAPVTPAYPYDITVSPAAGNVATVSEIVLNCPAWEWDYASNHDTSKAKITKDGADFCGVTFADNDDNYHNVIVTPAKALTEAGNYTVTFEAGCLSLFVNDSPTSINEPIVINYTVTGATGGVTTDLTPTKVYPADGATINVAEYFSNCTLEFASGTKVTSKASATFSCAEADWSKPVGIREFYGSFIVDISDLESELPQNGTYKLTIEEGSFGDATYAAGGTSGKTNPKLEYTYELTGVSNSGNDDEASVTSVEYKLPDADPLMLTAENSIAAFTNGTRIIFNTTNNLAVGYIRVEIEDKNAISDDDRMSVLESRARRTLPEDRGVFWQDDEVPFIELNRNLVFQEGHEYEFRAVLYNYETPPYSRLELDSYNAKISGTTPGYEYAEAKFVSISPDPETYTINTVEDGKFTVTFTDYVKLDLTRSCFPIDQGSTQLMTDQDVTYSDDHKSITVKFPEERLNTAKGSLAASLYVTDAEGRAVFTGNDAKENSYFSFTFACYLGSHDLTVEPAEGTVTELKDIYVSCPDGPTGGMIQYAYLPTPVTVRNLSGETIFATFPSTFEVVEHNTNKDGEYPTKIKLSLEEAITAPGHYVVYIPAAFFNMGSEYESEGCKQTFVAYTIEGEAKDETVYDFRTSQTSYAFNEDATEVKVTLTFPSDVQINHDVANNITLEDAEGITIEGADIRNEYDWDDLTLWYLVVKHNFEAGKTYNVVVPQGTFGDEQWGTDPMLQYLCGHANPAFKVEISTPSGVENVAADANERLDVYNLQGMLLIADADADQIAALPAGIYIIGGKKVTVK